MFGFLNVNKPEGMTSFDVVAIIRKITHIKQIGHTGTLDPFATGVLPVCIGKTTKLIEYLNDNKEYIATVKFGLDTDTYDKDGQVIKTYDKKITKDDILEILKDFRGQIEQIPPIYSAIKVNGKKLYEYARKGQNVEIKPRQVTIYEIKLLEFDCINQTAKLLVNCSKGTYIRSIAYDIGQKLSCGAYLKELKRTKAGMFDIHSSVELSNLKSIEDVEQNIINPVDVLPRRMYNMNENEKNKVLHGMSIEFIQEHFFVNSQDQPNNIVFLLYSGKMYGVGILENNKIIVKKVFEQV